MASIFQQRGLSLQIFHPPWQGGGLYGDYTDAVASYSHDIGAIGGFLSANLTLINQPFNDLESWIEDGLGKEVKVLSPGGTVFEGFINFIEFSVGGFHVSYGPLLDVCNKVMLVYSMIDWSTGEAITGLRGTSDWVNDTSSQIKYGIHTKVLSSGGIDPNVIDEILQLALLKLSRPKSAEDLSFNRTGGGVFSLQLGVSGWYPFLEKYNYASTDTTDVNLSARIKAIIQQEPNALFRTQLQENTLQVSLWENRDINAWGQIKGLLALGDASFTRYIFGIYEERSAIYSAVAQTISYYRPLRESMDSVLDASQNLVDPWLVRPGVYVKILDLIPTAVDEWKSPSTMFVESVSYRAPDSLTLNGSNSYKLDQRLAQLGISGLGI